MHPNVARNQLWQRASATELKLCRFSEGATIFTKLANIFLVLHLCLHGQNITTVQIDETNRRIIKIFNKKLSEMRRMAKQIAKWWKADRA